MAHGAPDRASSNFMGLASLGLEINIFCDSIYSVFLLNAILGLYFLGLARSRSQVARRADYRAAMELAKGWLDQLEVD